MTELIAKLSSIQKDLKAPKGQFNTFGKYNYRSCEDILEAVKPLLGDVPLTISDELVLIGDRYYVKSTVAFGGPSGIVTTAYAREEQEKKGMDSSQITGAASSYARKYALNGLFLIDDAKDSDATNTHGKEEKAPATPPASYMAPKASAKTSALPPTPPSQVNPDDIPEPENLSNSTEKLPEPEPKINATHKRVLTGLMKKDGIIAAADQIAFYEYGMAGFDTAKQAQAFISGFNDVFKMWKASKEVAA